MEIISVIVPIIFSLLPIVVIAIAVISIVSKTRKLTQNYLGMSPTQTMDLISKGIREEVTTPKAITELSAVYTPKIQRDFPEMGYAGMEALARNALIASFNAIEKKSTEGLLEISCSSALVNKVTNIINDLGSKGEEEVYDNVKIHRCGICSYLKKQDEAIVAFEYSLQYEYKKYKLGKLVSRTEHNGLVQAAYRVTLTYNQKAYEQTNNMVYTSNCPNCGAPVDVGDKTRECPYCGSGFSVINDRVWQVSDFNLLK
ncbi:MAG: zinc ribbon domain-containing protein [Ruminiclostridium sp.]|nr:zinc ribbon domain-containing protein [Ruminiclostridium sp.]